MGTISGACHQPEPRGTERTGVNLAVYSDGIGKLTGRPRLLDRRRNILAPVVFFANCRLIS